MSEKYTYKLICDNCLNAKDVEIDFGTSVKDFRKDFTCSKCGVRNG